MKRLVLPLYALAALTLLALCIAPQTRWLVAMQVGSALHLCHPFAWTEDIWGMAPDSFSYTGLPAFDRRREQAVAARDPDNISLQLALALPLSAATTGAAPHLRQLLPRFPDSPSLYANLLRCEMIHEIWLDQPDVDQFFGDPHKDRSKPTHVSTPLELARYDREAARGEQLDPGNAYFPLMRAIGLFAAHHDAEGLAAVQRASRKPRWREYFTEEASGHWRLRTLAFGDRCAINRAASTITLPHYQMLRAVARVTTYLAIQGELAGRAAQGTRLRQALIRCGGLMRVQSAAPIGSDLGIQITRLALVRPGGAALPQPPKLPAATDTHQVLNAYCAYLRQTHQADHSKPIIREFEAGEQVRTILGIRSDDTGLESNSPLWLISHSVLRDIFWWMADISLLTNILWLLLLGGLTAVLARIRPLRDGGPLPRPFQIAAPLLILLIPAAIGFAAYWQSNVREDLAAAARMFGEFDYGSDSFFTLRDEFLALFGYAGFVSVPLLLLLTLAVRSLVRRVPLAVGLVNGVRFTALPLACFLVLLYAVLLTGTVPQENALSRSLEQRQQGEGPYLARLSGQAWPGATP